MVTRFSSAEDIQSEVNRVRLETDARSAAQYGNAEQVFDAAQRENHQANLELLHLATAGGLAGGTMDLLGQVTGCPQLSTAGKCISIVAAAGALFSIF